MTPEEIVDNLLKEEFWRQILSSLCICFFARGVYTKEIVMEALAAAGHPKSAEEIEKIGKDIYREKFLFKIREGFSFDDLRMPERIFETPSPTMKFDRAFMEKAIQYAKKRVMEIINE